MPHATETTSIPSEFDAGDRAPRTQLHAALTSGATKAARDLVIVVGVLCEKCELLSGVATSRHESYSQRSDVELEAMLREFAENEAKLATLDR